MKKPFATLSALLLLSTTLAACNTDTSEPDTNTADNEKPQTEQTQTETSTEETTTTTQTTTEPAKDAGETNEPAQAKPQQTDEQATLTYSSNGQTFKEAVITSKSAEMNYSIEHFENYTLEAEEPGIDHLLYNADDNFSMQIEVTEKGEVTFDDIKSSVTESMSAISSDVKEHDFSAILEHHTDIIQIVGYETTFENTDKVIKLAFERDNMFVTLTIYDTVAADLQDAFLQMGLTIQ
ncbi:chemotaxis protein [Solibacillus daqui]|uniref:chemotaxis protein n=1 Tax=Solibacillus daqui TaxID=2912187 RepID=UPI002366C0F3|nr:chemotaxis protein [Solibacillus daqui]